MTRGELAELKGLGQTSAGLSKYDIEKILDHLDDLFDLAEKRAEDGWTEIGTKELSGGTAHWYCNGKRHDLEGSHLAGYSDGQMTVNGQCDCDPVVIARREIV